MRGWEHVRESLLRISPKLPLFWGRTGAKPGVKMGKNVFIYPEMAMFFLIFTPGFAPVRPHNKGNLGDI